MRQWKMASVHSSLSVISTCFQWVLVLHLWYLVLARVDAGSVNGSEQVRALSNFKNANAVPNPFPNPGGYWITWNENDESPCAWTGVMCTANDTVEELDLSGWGLDIVSLEALYNLKDLRHLDLSYNFLYVPAATIGNFTGLTWLDLTDTNIDESALSSISACRNLRFLGLAANMMDEVPSGIRDLANLQSLNLSGMVLRVVLDFPTEALGNISTLVSLDLSGDLSGPGMQGTIPALPNLTNLVELKLDWNNFTAFDNDWFLGTKSLQRLTVSHNPYLGGTIPSSLANFPSLVQLSMSNCSLTGKIPRGFSAQMSFGFSLDLSQNQLSGEIPTDMLQQSGTFQAGCPSVNLSNNQLTGNILIGGTNSHCFSVLDFSNNNLSGTIPSNIFSNGSTFIALLWLQNNSLSGDVVDLFLSPGFSRTSDLRLGNNKFTGDLSRMNASIKDYTWLFLTYLDLSYNHLRWSTSEAIQDPVAATLLALTSGSLSTFLAAGNDFSGTPLPKACYPNSFSQNQNVIQVIDLSNCHLTGPILDTAFGYSCYPYILYLNLSNNQAIGPVSEGIITPYCNVSSGQCIEGLPPYVLDVSNNSLSGPLPTISPNDDLYNPKYFLGNPLLCGPPLSKCLEPPRSKGVQWWVLLIIIGGSVTIALASCLFATRQWRAYQKLHQQDADLIQALLERGAGMLMPLRDIRRVTDNFADSARIGEGGFGTVYMGKLNDGTIVAIKRSKREGSETDKEQFLNEVKILSQVNHRHLVKLLGCCMENKIAVLVFEFVSNGTLQEHLQGKIGEIYLSWIQRLNIAIQTADALSYLHSTATHPIIHRDVKSANILLNEDLNAKVADFGISKLAPLNATHVSTAAVQGTMGYIDPEYYTSFQLTDKSDVYSFGVVLLELISAKPALDFRRGGDETGLVNLARPYVERGDLEGFIDHCLIETYRDPTHLGRESILNTARLAMRCLDMQSKGRPNMNEVFKELQTFRLRNIGTSKKLDSINEYSDDGLQGENTAFLSDSLSRDSSTFPTQNDWSGIEMPHLPPFSRFRSKSMQ